MKKLLIIAVLLVVGTRIFSQEREIFLADPTIYVENGKYYLVGTKNRPPLGFSILESKDLKSFWRRRRCPDGLPPVDFGYSLSTTRKGVRKQNFVFEAPY